MTTRVLPALAILGCFVAAVVTTIAVLSASHPAYQVDWRVHVAGALGFLDHSLYRHPLELDGLHMSAEEFKLPPLAAVWAIPLAGLDPFTGGIVWATLGMVALGIASWFMAVALGATPAWIWAGIGMGVYAFHPLFFKTAVQGNINQLMLLLVAWFVVAHLRGQQRTAGVLLGLAIATKLWPLPLAVVAIRERRWLELRWAAGVLGVQAIAMLAWLGTDAIGPMIQTARFDIDPETYPLLWISALQRVEWWPSWGGIAIALGLMAIPARGRVGMGLAIVAGLSLVINLWPEYAPTLAFGFALIAVELMRNLRQRSVARLRPVPDPSSPVSSPPGPDPRAAG